MAMTVGTEMKFLRTLVAEIKLAREKADGEALLSSADDLSMLIEETKHRDVRSRALRTLLIASGETEHEATRSEVISILEGVANLVGNRNCGATRTRQYVPTYAEEVESPAPSSNTPLRREEACTYLMKQHNYPISSTYLGKFAVVGGGPAFRKIGRYPFYAPADLDEWVKGRTSRSVHSMTELKMKE